MGVRRLGIFLSSMVASPPSTFFSWAFTKAVVATRAVAVRKLRRVALPTPFSGAGAEGDCAGSLGSLVTNR